MLASILIDGIIVQTDKGVPLLQAIKKAGITMPTLCHHEHLKPYGSCRLCMVEIVHNGQTRLATSCTYPSDSAMEVRTDTSQLRKIRRMLLKLLLVRCPDSTLLQDMAKKAGVEKSDLLIKGTDNCILCGLCVRFCEEIVGVRAIGLANRGTEREVSTPFKMPSDVCIGCGSCSFICPTGCIEMVKEDSEMDGQFSLKIGNHTLEPCTNDQQCETCSIEKEFIEGFQNSIAAFRKTVNE